MITRISDLTASERVNLATHARCEAERYTDDRYGPYFTYAERMNMIARWRAIAEAFESGGKEDHGVQPGVSTTLPLSGLPLSGIAENISVTKEELDWAAGRIFDAGTGGPC